MGTEILIPALFGLKATALFAFAFSQLYVNRD